MGSNETATATTGGPRVIAYLTGTGHHRVQIIYFFWMQVAPRAPSGVGLVVSCRPRRIRHRCDSLVLPESLEANHGKKMAKPSGLLREIGQKCLKRRRMRCRRVHVYSTGPRRPQGHLLGRD